MVQEFFRWLGALEMSKGISESNWIFAVIQAFHLVALGVFFGALLVVDIRLLGRGFRQQSLRQVARDAQPWLIAGLLALIITGIPQLMSTAMKQYFATLFWWKMGFLLAALIFTFTVRWKVSNSDESRVGSVLPKVVGLVSIFLWMAVAIPARLIGLF
jgi:putative copper export protein